MRSSTSGRVGWCFRAKPLWAPAEHGKTSFRYRPKISCPVSTKYISLHRPFLLSDRDTMAPTDRAAGSKKRKIPKDSSAPSSKRRVVADNEPADAMAEILELEDQISQSRKYYNNIATLISMLNAEEPGQQPNLLAAVSLCRVFSRLIAGGNLTDSNRAAENEKIIVAWLKERYQEYQRALLAILREADASSQVSIPHSVPRVRGSSA